jgi:hypothetical protein
MPRKDNSQSGRQRKKDSKKDGGKQIYSSKHIRIHEALQGPTNFNKDQTNFNQGPTNFNQGDSNKNKR